MSSRSTRMSNDGAPKPSHVKWWAKKPEAEVDEKDNYKDVIKSLKRLYTTGLRPLEELYNYSYFQSQLMDDADFDAKPMVLLVGQYSTGKTSLIKYIIGRDFPGMSIGPEPTTDGFMALMEGEKDLETGLVTEGLIPGHALVSDKSKPFRTLNAFGTNFISRFQCSSMASPVLENITLIDSPGILAGRMEQLSRGYDYAQVLSWFAERVDRIILLFDVNKLDASDEFLKAFEKLMPYESKIRIVLNKCDQINAQQLMRVYGALMWSLGKITKTPEVTRVYVGSFWDEQLRFTENRQLFENEKKDLFDDLRKLPRDATKRKLNDLILRVTTAKVHAYIISTLKEKMKVIDVTNTMRNRRKKTLIKNLGKIFDEISEEHTIPRGDFPDVEMMQEKLKSANFKTFHRLRPDLIEKAEAIYEEAVSLNSAIRHDEATLQIAKPDGMKGGAFNKYGGNPFAHRWGEGVMMGVDLDNDHWIVDEMKEHYDLLFHQIKGPSGRVSGQQFKKNVQQNSNLTNITLAKIWKLADYDKDGHLDDEEYALAMHLLNLSKEGHTMPDALPKHLIPLSQRATEDIAIEHTTDSTCDDDDEENVPYTLEDTMEEITAGTQEENVEEEIEPKPTVAHPVSSITGRGLRF